MTIVLHLPPETEAKLKHRSRLTGESAETIALETLRDGLSGDSPTVRSLSKEALLAEFDAWIASQKPRNANFDDSRESIYPDRA